MASGVPIPAARGSPQGPNQWFWGAAVVLAAAGTILVSGISNAGDWKIVPIGLLIALGSAITYGSLSLFGKKLSGDYNPWTIMFYIFTFGSLTLFAVQMGRPDPWPVQSDFLPLFLGFVLISTIVVL